MSRSAPHALAAAAARNGLLTAAEVVDLARAARAGDAKARERLILGNIPLVIALATPSASLGRARGLDLDDLLQEGLAGLIRAVDKFDPEAGFKLSTYASYWIRQFISRALDERGGAVHVPAWASTLARRVDREPSLAPRLTAKHRACVADARRAARVRGAGDVGGGVDSLGDLRCREDAPGAESERAEWAAHLLDGLDDREREVISGRFALGGRGRETLAGLGERLGYTREHIRKIQDKALAKMRERAEVA